MIICLHILCTLMNSHLHSYYNFGGIHHTPIRRNHLNSLLPWIHSLNSLLPLTILKYFSFVDDWAIVNKQRFWFLTSWLIFGLVRNFDMSAKFGTRFLYSCTLNMVLNMLKCLINQIAEVWLQWQSQDYYIKLSMQRKRHISRRQSAPKIIGDKYDKMFSWAYKTVLFVEMETEKRKPSYVDTNDMEADGLNDFCLFNVISQCHP